jgi:hypothetical protein
MMLLTETCGRKLKSRGPATINPDANLCFALFQTSRIAAQMPEDLDLLDVAVRGIEQLNAPETQFFLFHRSRRFCRTQQCWMLGAKRAR